MNQGNINDKEGIGFHPQVRNLLLTGCFHKSSCIQGTVID